jgi:hypothetical protein
MAKLYCFQEGTCCFIYCNFNLEIIRNKLGRSILQARNSGKTQSPTHLSLHIECLIRNGLHRKRRVQHFFYCCVCTLCRRKVFIDPLPSNGPGTCIPSRCLATAREMLTEPLSSKDSLNIQTKRLRRSHKSPSVTLKLTEVD